MAKKIFIIQIKYPEQPWVEWCRTIVPAIVDHYEQGARMEHPEAEVRTVVVR